jgi:mannose-1-phosphate guanylyltransferase
MIALIMAGGVGTRFWPLSRTSKPKQFLNIASQRSMIQMTVDRLLPKIAMEDIYVVTGASQVALTQEHLPQMPRENIIVEPFGMNTAPCIALSAAYLQRRYASGDVMVVLPADHLIKDQEAFLASLDAGEAAACQEQLVTFGIQPSYPATGYGYIEGGDELQSGMFNVKQFKEKPDVETAVQFLASGNFYWNSGMFMWKIDTILDAFAAHLPEVMPVLKSINAAWDAQGTNADFAAPYAQMPKLPIDIGIMERAPRRVVIPVNYGWSDVGSWKALYDISETDANNNVLQADVQCINSSGCYVRADKTVALIGAENLIVVDTPDALLVADMKQSEAVKKIVDTLKADKSRLV